MRYEDPYNLVDEAELTNVPLSVGVARPFPLAVPRALTFAETLPMADGVAEDGVGVGDLVERVAAASLATVQPPEWAMTFQVGEVVEGVLQGIAPLTVDVHGKEGVFPLSATVVEAPAKRALSQGDRVTFEVSSVEPVTVRVAQSQEVKGGGGAGARLLMEADKDSGI